MMQLRAQPPFSWVQVDGALLLAPCQLDVAHPEADGHRTGEHPWGTGGCCLSLWLSQVCTWCRRCMEVHAVACPADFLLETAASSSPGQVARCRKHHCRAFIIPGAWLSSLCLMRHVLPVLAGR